MEYITLREVLCIENIHCKKVDMEKWADGGGEEGERQPFRPYYG